MNENAGLLQDLIAMSERGTPLDPERINRIAGKITGQVQRADSVVKNLNRFAHSTDDLEKSMDLMEALSLTTALNRRLAVNRGVELNLTDPEDLCVVSANPFLFQYLIGRCLDLLIETGPGKRIDLMLKRTGVQVTVSFMLDNGLGDVESIMNFRTEYEAVLQRLGCKMDWDEKQTEMRLIFQPSDKR
jgi:signal transduction histidine kinase